MVHLLSLPQDRLKAIFEYVCSSQAGTVNHPTVSSEARKAVLQFQRCTLSLLLVGKAFHKAIRAHVYHSVLIDNSATLIAFNRFISRRPDVQPLVRNFSLFINEAAPLPDNLHSSVVDACMEPEEDLAFVLGQSTSGPFLHRIFKRLSNLESLALWSLTSSSYTGDWSDMYQLQLPFIVVRKRIKTLDIMGCSGFSDMPFQCIRHHQSSLRHVIIRHNSITIDEEQERRVPAPRLEFPNSSCLFDSSFQSYLVTFYALHHALTVAQLKDFRDHLGPTLRNLGITIVAARIKEDEVMQNSNGWETDQIEYEADDGLLITEISEVLSSMTKLQDIDIRLVGRTVFAGYDELDTSIKFGLLHAISQIPNLQTLRLRRISFHDKEVIALSSHPYLASLDIPMFGGSKYDAITSQLQEGGFPALEHLIFRRSCRVILADFQSASVGSCIDAACERGIDISLEVDEYPEAFVA